MRILVVITSFATLQALAFSQRTEGVGESVQAFVVRTEEPGSSFGHAATGVGDVDGDGFDDVAVGAPEFGPTDEGKVYLYRGGAPVSRTPAWAFAGGLDGARFGYSIAGAGDVNGDGYADVLVGAPGTDGAGEWAGAAHVFLGSPSGLGSLPDWTVLGAHLGDSLGFTVSGAGDVDGDGYDDVVVGVPGYWVSWNEGLAQVFRGGPGGLDTSPWQEVVGGPGDALGRQVTGVGDVDGDGYDDVLILQDYYAGLHRGSPTGLIAAGAPLAPACISGYALDGAGAGDLNADGMTDLIVSHLHHGDLCRSVHLGAPGGYTAAVWIDDGSTYQFGNAVGLGEFDGDGFGDLVVGRGERPPFGAEFYRGTATGLEPTPFLTVTTPFLGFVGTDPWSAAYSHVGAAGDVNGDGLADAILADDYGYPYASEHFQIVFGPGVTRARRLR